MYIPQEIAKKYVNAALAKTKVSPAKTFGLAIFAGIFIALGAFGSQIVSIEPGGASVGKFLSALVFPVGLLMVIVAGAELFTGNSLMLISVLDRKITLLKMFKNWGIVYLGNFIGSLLIVWLLTYSHSYSVFDGKLAETVVATAQHKVELTFLEGFLRGILCNILVCIAVWISFAAEELAGKILGLFLPVMLFVVSGYEHCVANMYFIPAGLMVSGEYHISTDTLTWGSLLIKNLLPVTLGNIVGGAGIVGLGYFWIYLSAHKETKEIKL